MSRPARRRRGSGIGLVGLYAVFAAIALCANLGSQWLASAVLARVLSPSYAIVAALLVGTVIGVVVKYALDKRYIFRYQTTSVGHEARTFVVYALLSVATTIVFWAFELGSAAVFQTDVARYAGGAVGLVVGYTVKYVLDSKYTFVRVADGGVEGRA